MFIKMLKRHTGCVAIFLKREYHETNLARDDLLVDLNGLVGEKGRVACRHLVHENAQGPPVHRLVVALQIRVKG